MSESRGAAEVPSAVGAPPPPAFVVPCPPVAAPPPPVGAPSERAPSRGIWYWAPAGEPGSGSVSGDCARARAGPARHATTIALTTRRLMRSPTLTPGREAASHPPEPGTEVVAAARLPLAAALPAGLV